MPNTKDKEIVKSLAKEIAQIAALPVQEEKRTLWRKLNATRDICKANGCPLEFILKDISTVAYEPKRLDALMKIAMRVVGA